MRGNNNYAQLNSQHGHGFLIATKIACAGAFCSLYMKYIPFVV